MSEPRRPGPSQGQDEADDTARLRRPLANPDALTRADRVRIEGRVRPSPPAPTRADDDLSFWGGLIVGVTVSAVVWLLLGLLLRGLLRLGGA